MKIAISSTGNTTESFLDTRFGRCSCFAVLDTENNSVEFIPNANKDSVEGAGPASVQLIASLGVSGVISGEFGSKVNALLDSLQIQQTVIRDPGKKISEVISMLNH